MNLNSSPNGPFLRLPSMRTHDDALAISKTTGDPFFLCAFLLRNWISNLVTDAFLTYRTADYCPCDVLQDGQAWSGFRELFPGLEDNDFHLGLEALFRFVQYDDRFARTLLRARVPLEIEHQLTGRPLLPEPVHSVRLLRHTAEFWCDWLEATIHLEIHRVVQEIKKGSYGNGSGYLVAFGYPKCALPPANGSSAYLDEQIHPASFPRRNNVAPEISRADDPPSPGEEIETLLVGLQPLAKRYKWTSADFFTVIVDLARRPAPGLCWTQSDLERYRREKLGLPPLSVEQLPGPPAGLALARKICPPESAAK